MAKPSVTVALRCFTNAELLWQHTKISLPWQQGSAEVQLEWYRYMLDHYILRQTLSAPSLHRFLQGVSIACYASPVLAIILMPVCLSVRPSFTRWHGVKTTQARITKSSLTDSPKTQVFGIKNSSTNSKGFTPSEGVKWEWGRKISNFQPISRRISETVQDRTKVTINN